MTCCKTDGPASGIHNLLNKTVYAVVAAFINIEVITSTPAAPEQRRAFADAHFAAAVGEGRLEVGFLKGEWSQANRHLGLGGRAPVLVCLTGPAGAFKQKGTVSLWKKAFTGPFTLLNGFSGHFTVQSDQICDLSSLFRVHTTYCQKMCYA